MTHEAETARLESTTTPFVSVIIPCHDEERWIGITLDAVLRQTYPRDRYEVLVVDNGSDDRTADLARRFPVRVLLEPQRSSYRARNLGVRRASGDFLAFLDADCIPVPNWLESLVAVATMQTSPLVAGAVENQIVIRNYANLLLSQKRSKDLRRESVEAHASVPGGNMLVAARLFEEHGLFEPARSGADTEFSRRITQGGETISYAAEATVIHQCDLSNRDFLKRTFRIHYGQNQLSSSSTSNRVSHLLNRMTAVPWRPGLRALRPFDIGDHPKNPLYRFGLWLYIWADRWAEYAGSVAGSMMAFRSPAPSDRERRTNL